MNHVSRTWKRDLTADRRGRAGRKTLATNGLAAALALLATGCMTRIKPTASTNPAPAEKFSAFARMELEKIELAPSLAGEASNREAAAVIQAHIEDRLATLLAPRNGRDAGRGGRVLMIRPSIEELRVVSSAQRVWGGALAGSSAVIMKVRYIDKATGRTIADPQFYQRAAAMAGAWSYGAHDRSMLTRVADLMADYTVANCAQAVGGPTGGGD